MRVYHLGPACLRFFNAVVLPDEINTALDDVIIFKLFATDYK